MKNFKKVLALVFALALVLSSVAAFAATNYTITLPSTLSGATYDIYQILTGTYNKDASNKETLSDVHWGSSTSKSGDVATDTELKAIAELADGKPETARTLFTTYCTGSAAYTDKAAGAEVSVPEGYYLIKEKLPASAEGQEVSLYVVEVVGDVTITRKANTTSSDKTVDDINDSTGESKAKDTSSDYDIGDEVPYHVTATISESVGNYPKYHITIEDQLESGKFDAITLNKTAIKLDGAAIGDTDDYTVVTTWNKDPDKTGFKVTYEFTPKTGKTLDSLKGKTIAIDFTAKLGENATIGMDGNHNTLKVSYSNNPNNSDGKDEGTTPDKTVVTFTYKVVVDKTDDQNKPLPNAGFTLYKIAASQATAKDGDAATQNAAWEAASNLAKYVKPANGDTSFSFEGLDDGYYVLCETVTPSGYNTMTPVIFKVEAVHTSSAITSLSGDKVSGEITFSVDTSAGTLKTSVVNKGGTTLPETGGMGTTIFYVAGSILALAAIVLLVTKRRMNAED